MTAKKGGLLREERGKDEEKSRTPKNEKMGNGAGRAEEHRKGENDMEVLLPSPSSTRTPPTACLT